jgi:hypothetical protein
MKRTPKDWVLLFVTVAGFTAVAGAYLGYIWPRGPGGIAAAVIGIAVMVLMLWGNVRWSDGS